MNRENAIKLIPIIQAFADGKTIEYNNLQGIWVSNTEIGFNDDYNRYRIKLTPKLVPFTFEDNLLFRDKWIQYKNGYKNPKYKIIIYDEIQITIIGCNRNSFDYTYEKFMQVFEFEDGSPCGKYVNE